MKMVNDSIDFGEFDIDDNEPLTGGNQSRNSKKTPDQENALWTFKYYQQFFDVDTEQVKSRIIWGMIPRPGVNYVNNCIQPNPDLYGPFWICVTLVFTIAISGNIVNYWQNGGTGSHEWRYDFHIVSYTATAIFCYAMLIPIALWGFIRNNEYSGVQGTMQAPLSLLELLCVYGYSLGIYVPVSMLWVVQIPWLQWTLVFLGASLSGFVLVTTIAPSLHGPKKFPLLIGVIGLHFLLAAGFMLCLFHVPSMTPDTSSPHPNQVVVSQTLMNNTKVTASVKS